MKVLVDIDIKECNTLQNTKSGESFAREKNHRVQNILCNNTLQAFMHGMHSKLYVKQQIPKFTGISSKHFGKEQVDEPSE